MPCICHSRDITESFFTNDKFNILRKLNKDVFIFNGHNNNDINIVNYINKGELEQINLKYITSRRNPWFSMEKRTPSPIWVSVFNRTGLRFIRNEANIANLTTFHCIYPLTDQSGVTVDLLFAYLLTKTARLIFEDNCREYGNGLQKFEPNDLNKAKALDLKLLSEDEIIRILEHYNNYRVSVFSNKTNSHLIDKIDRILLDKYLL